jgi:hypothetical protein
MPWQLCDISGRDGADPVPIRDEAELRTTIGRLAELPPRVVSIGPAGAGYLQIGVGGPWAFVEFCRDQPWRSEAAVPDPTSRGEEPPESVWFACGGDSSEIGGEYLLPVGDAVALVAAILRSGTLPPSVRWELQ